MQKRIKPGSIALGGAILFSIAAISFASLGSGPRFSTVTGDGPISISTATLRSGEARFYIYHLRNGASVKFIVARDETGRIQAAIDACERCAAYREGYSFSDGHVVCRFCGNRYKIGSLASGAGSCVPFKLRYTLHGDAVQISSAELNKWSQLF